MFIKLNEIGEIHPKLEWLKNQVEDNVRKKLDPNDERKIQTEYFINQMTVVVKTEDKEYHIDCQTSMNKEIKNKDYLGCIVEFKNGTMKDLPDGEIGEDTLNRIVERIIKIEASSV